ncbi:MAG: hypothetical protein ACTHJH_15035 [Marmoricola sp.]
MLRVVAALLVLWLVLIVVGALVKALLWLLVLGAVLFVATAAIGWVKGARERSGSR